MGQSRSTSYYGHDLWDRAAPPVSSASMCVCVYSHDGENLWILKNEPNFPLCCPYVSSSATSVCDSAHRVIRHSSSYPNNSPALVNAVGPPNMNRTPIRDPLKNNKRYKTVIAIMFPRFHNEHCTDTKAAACMFLNDLLSSGLKYYSVPHQHLSRLAHLDISPRKWTDGVIVESWINMFSLIVVVNLSLFKHDSKTLEIMLPLLDCTATIFLLGRSQHRPLASLVA